MFNLKNSISLRIIIIGFLSLILLIPVLMIQNIIVERFGRLTETQTEISGKWGSDQNVIGPVLVIPKFKIMKSANGEIHKSFSNIYILPEKLNLSGQIIPQIRYRGIYKAVLYSSLINFSGTFDLQNLNGEDESGILLNDAYLLVGISDLKGINQAIEIEWQKDKIKAKPGIKDNTILLSGVTIDVPLTSDEIYNFNLNLNLNGSRDLFFAPVGKITTLQLSSEWPDPIFTGSFLPEKHDITEKGFTANWHVLNFNRNYPQQWVGNKYNINESAFGVSLKFPVDIYQKTERITKYAILIIGLTFLTFFMIEVLGKRQLHPVQYILIGFALLIFYILLLALSEYIGFDWSYFVAAISIISLITLYCKSVLSNKFQILSVLGLLTFLYFYLYVILQLQDFALLMGSAGLFAILAIVMYLTRKIDWFNVILKRQRRI